MSNMSRKNLKVSEAVHTELEVQKRRDESFDDVLRRALGITPTTVDELTTYYPDTLKQAATYLVDCLENEERYEKVVTDNRDHHALNFDSKESGRTILQLQFQDKPLSVVARYRNNRGDLERLGEVIQQEDEGVVIVDFNFRRPDNGKRFSHTDAFREVDENDFEQALQSIQDAAYDRWG